MIRFFFYLGKFDKTLERRVLPAHLSKSIVSGICMTFLYSLYQISASSRKIIDLLSLLFRNNSTEYKNQVTECANLNNSYGTQKFMNLFNYWPGHLPIMLKHFSKCWWCTMYSNAKSHCLVVWKNPNKPKPKPMENLYLEIANCLDWSLK